MAKNRKSSAKAAGENYYYAGGQRIELEPATDLLAVDESALRQADLPASAKKALTKAARQLTSGISLIDRDAVDGVVADALANAGALQPVFRAMGALLVALPEVRVEFAEGAAKKQGLEKWLAARGDEAAIEKQSDGRITIRPTSGYGGDALAIANALAEEVKPEVAQPRFVRIVRRPGAVRPKN
jgi:hypothetical protein